MTLAACGSSATRAPAAEQPKADAAAPATAPPATDTQKENTSAAPAASTSKYRLPKDFSISDTHVEMLGVPLYPGSATLELPGLGNKVELKNSEGGSTSVNYILEDGVSWPDVVRFYKDALEPNGWKGISGILTVPTENLPMGMVAFQKDKLIVVIRFADGSQENTSPMLSVIYSQK
jgi:hypothetical protein